MCATVLNENSNFMTLCDENKLNKKARLRLVHGVWENVSHMGRKKILTPNIMILALLSLLA